MFVNEDEEKDLVELGKFYFLNKKFEKSIEVFNKILKQEKDNIDAFYNLGLNYEALNDFDQAKFYYKKAVELKPTHKLAKDHLSKIIGRE